MVVSEELWILASCLLRPVSRNSVLVSKDLLHPGGNCYNMRISPIFDVPDVSVLAFSALTLLVGRQEEHPACKN